MLEKTHKKISKEREKRNKPDKKKEKKGLFTKNKEDNLSIQNSNVATPLAIEAEVDGQQDIECREILPNLLEDFTNEWKNYMDLILTDHLSEQTKNEPMTEKFLNQLIQKHIDANERLAASIEQSNTSEFKKMKEIMSDENLRNKLEQDCMVKNQNNTQHDPNSFILSSNIPNDNVSTNQLIDLQLFNKKNEDRCNQMDVKDEIQKGAQIQKELNHLLFNKTPSSQKRISRKTKQVSKLNRGLKGQPGEQFGLTCIDNNMKMNLEIIESIESDCDINKHQK